MPPDADALFGDELLAQYSVPVAGGGSHALGAPGAGAAPPGAEAPVAALEDSSMPLQRPSTPGRRAATGTPPPAEADAADAAAAGRPEAESEAPPSEPDVVPPPPPSEKAMQSMKEANKLEAEPDLHEYNEAFASRARIVRTPQYGERP